MFQENMNFPIVLIIGSIISFVLVFGFFLFLAKMRKNQLQFKLQNERMKSQFEQALLQTQIEIQDHTLNNISEEIHDNIGQVLSLVKLNLNTFPPGLEDATQKKLHDTETLLSKAIEDLRDLSQSMNTDKIHAIGLEAAVTKLLKQVKKTGRHNTHLQIGGNRYALEAQKEMVLFRIVQETVHNSIKHSGAKNIEIEMLYRPGSFIMQVSDDGSGFNAEAGHPSKAGLGLQSMHKRAVLIGANFSVHSYPDKGTTINIELPTAVP